ncbi:hypothetical protein CKO42_11655 [Lamprobacter modestohalophilus]|uniref:Uncharacterized protein n=1 Tax=Lamprobacter modestohalophilus TaxID=1064514 RepID=A0A9X0W8T9_9GAMM|nr:hypothetical protein [Lamprobacter modestohalophilus]MBK1619075.1 hypothetical protein [Lamprobacter modestohalophilus]
MLRRQPLAEVIGQAGNGPSRAPAVDATGELIVFESAADNLVSGDSNGVSDIFLHDIAFRHTQRLTEAEYASAHPGIDASGGDVVFDQQAPSGLRSVQTRNLLDASDHRTLSLAETPTGAALDNHHPVISADGRFVAYLEETVSEKAQSCQVHVFDRSTEVYHRQACPEALATASDSVRPRFSPEADTLFWSLPGQAEPIVLDNPLAAGHLR